MRTFWLALFLLLGNLASAQLSEQPFQRPDLRYAPSAHWLWKSDQADKQGINLDLEAMAAAGMRGGNLDLYTMDPARLDSVRWKELLLHALQQAERLGLDFSLDLPASFNQEVRKIHPELAAQRLVWSEIGVNGQQMVDRLLPKPQSNPLFYKDLAVLAFPDGPLVDESQIKNLSDQLTVEGRLNWNVPKGNWTIVRFGYTLSEDSTHGRLSLDLLSQPSTRQYFDVVLKPLLEPTAPFHGRSLTGLSLAHQTTTGPTWSPLLREEFQKRAGYDVTPYLLTFTGRVVGNAQQVSRFRWDLQNVLSKMRVENHVGVLQTLLRPYNLTLNVGQNVTVSHLQAPMQLKALSDSLPNEPLSIAFELLPYGVAANQTDSVTVLNRNNPLLDKYADCFTYLSRCRSLFQHVVQTAQGACFLGEESIGTNSSRWSLDCLTREMLLDSATVRNHLLTLPDGRAYRFLLLPDTRILSLPLLRKLKEWLSDGLWVSALKPKTWAGMLQAGERAEWAALVQELWSQLPEGVYRYGAGRLFIDNHLDRLLRESGWKPDYDLVSNDTTRNLGVRHLRIGKDEAWFLNNRLNRCDTVLLALRITGMQPEWWNPQTGEVRKIRVFRQQDEQTFIPFLLEPHESGFIVFRKKPNEAVYDGIDRDGERVFSADPNVFPHQVTTGRTPLEVEKTTALPLLLQQKDGFLVRSKSLYTLVQPGMLPKKQPKMVLKADLPAYELITPDSDWLTGRANDTATWRCRFSLAPSDLSGNRLLLDLGCPSNVMADIFVNGKSAGSLWTSPYRVEVTNLVGVGENSLEIRVRSIGPMQGKQDPVLLSVWKLLKI